ncbi:Uncharacterised protein [uncultured archaeon]|nr:Uncharacterised protein [uncultured archaeon]
MVKSKMCAPMKKTNRLLRRKWDDIFYCLIKATFDKFGNEVSEHAAFMKWVAKRILMPLTVFYVLTGLIFFKIYVVGSLFLGALFFIYSNFLPDLDSLMIATNDKKRVSEWHEKYLLLFFAPVLVYYAVSGQAKPIYTTKGKEFHTTKALVTYVCFLFLFGLVLWRNPLQHTILPIFGGLGYLTHLAVDNIAWGCIIHKTITRSKAYHLS